MILDIIGNMEFHQGKMINLMELFCRETEGFPLLLEMLFQNWKLPRKELWSNTYE